MNGAMIQNPVLRGFNPDPSIVRVGEDYYIATSTFEWWPGVQLHHSRDLIHWRLAGHALTRESQLNLRGIADSGGVITMGGSGSSTPTFAPVEQAGLSRMSVFS
jgi:xylan 1,4-beta-xylosidase